MKKSLVGFSIVAMFGLGLVGCTKGEVPDEQWKSEDSTEQTVGSSTVESSEQKEPYKKDEVQLSTLEQQVLDAFQQSFQSTGPVRFDSVNKYYIITPTDPQFTQEMAAIMDGTLSLDVWTNLVQNVQQTSLGLQDTLGSGYTIIIENPFETGQMFLAVSDGEVVFDGLTEYMTGQNT